MTTNNNLKPGDRFNSWTIISELERHPSQRRMQWLCRCDCGTYRVLFLQSISGKSRGCLSCRSARNPQARSHGMSSSSEYRCWEGMLQRCRNPKNSSFKYYGGRGILVCERWLKFENFSLDMGPRPNLDYSVERVDNNKGYEPGNCKWATKKEQQNNRRGLRLLSLGGETMNATAWSEKIGVPSGTILRRIKDGWSVLEALSA